MTVMLLSLMCVVNFPSSAITYKTLVTAKGVYILQSQLQRYIQRDDFNETIINMGIMSLVSW